MKAGWQVAQCIVRKVLPGYTRNRYPYLDEPHAWQSKPRGSGGRKKLQVGAHITFDVLAARRLETEGLIDILDIYTFSFKKARQFLVGKSKGEKQHGSQV